MNIEIVDAGANAKTFLMADAWLGGVDIACKKVTTGSAIRFAHR